MKWLLIFTSFFFIHVLAFAGQLKIGCAYTCDGYTIEALHQSAKVNSSTVEILDLSVEQEVPWNKLDGIVIPGGADVDPKFYLRHVEPELREHIRRLDFLVEYSEEGKARDGFEYELLRHYFTSEHLKNFPLLGICRGMQIMGVAMGIPLYVDLKAELGIRNRIDRYDEIHVEDSSTMELIFPRKKFQAYKSHHQGLRVPYFYQHQHRWPNARLTAFSNGGKIAEGLELLDRPALGVQFHPEVDDDSTRRAIFGWFIKLAQKRAEKRSVNQRFQDD